MSEALRIDDDAQLELDAAARWYSRQRRGLGDELLEEIDATLARIVERPKLFRLAPRVPTSLGVRRAFVERFPYTVMFMELDEQILVLAFVHAHRRPGYWLRRLP